MMNATMSQAAVIAILSIAATLAATAIGANDARCLEYGMTPLFDDVSPGNAAPALATPRADDALGFVLGSTTRSDVNAWLSLQDISCEGDAHRLSCEDAPIPGIDASYDQVVFRFDNSGRLHGVDAVRIVRDVDVAKHHVAAANERIEDAVGPPTASNDGDADTLSKRYGRVHNVFRYAGFSAEVTATNFCGRGIRIHESYRAR
jgi:hypothetical protein